MVLLSLLPALGRITDQMSTTVSSAAIAPEQKRKREQPSARRRRPRHCGKAMYRWYGFKTSMWRCSLCAIVWDAEK